MSTIAKRADASGLVPGLPPAAAGATARPRRWPLRDELLLGGAGLLAFWLFPDDLGLLTRILATALLTMSLWLILGLTGIASLGQAAFSGLGAYAAGLFALHCSQSALAGLAVGGLAGAGFALLSGAMLLRTHGLAFLMLTIAVGQLAYESANKLSGWTGGDDGLSGYQVAPLFGQFPFDMYGRTGYLYSLGVVLLCFFLVRRIAASPFGLTCRGIRADPGRMELLGASVYRHRLVVYSISGLLAGFSGALSAQVVGSVGLSGIDFALSADIMVMLIVGGSAGPWGAVIGTVGYMAIHHLVSNANPFHWMMVMGGLLIAVVLFLPQGLLGLPSRVREWWQGRAA